MSGWIRLNADAPKHRKVACLSDAEFRAWIVLLCDAKTRLDPTWANDRHMGECVGKYARHRDALVAAGLLERDGEAYIVHDFDRYQVDPTNADRQRRHRDAARESNARVTLPVTVPVTAGNAQTRQDSTRQDGTLSPARAREDVTIVPEGEALAWLALHGAYVNPTGGGLHRRLALLCERHGSAAVVGALSSLGDGLSDRQYVLGAENALDRIPQPDTRAEADAAEAERKAARERARQERIDRQRAEYGYIAAALEGKEATA